MLHLHVLGAPVLRGPSGPVTGRAAYKRRIALLAILAVARRRPVGRERLIGLLWAEHPADAARHNLSESLYVLRKDLGEGAFVAVGDDLVLSPDVVSTDVAAFEEALEERRLEDAVAAYGGPFMDGFYVSDAPEFEHWVDGERDRLARAYAQALEALAVRAEEEGRLPDAAEWWRRLAAHDPWSSRVALRLADVLDAAGERSAALRALAAHGARVRAEMEMEPDAAVRALEQRLRTVPPSPPPAAPPSRPRRSASPGFDGALDASRAGLGGWRVRVVRGGAHRRAAASSSRRERRPGGHPRFFSNPHRLPERPAFRHPASPDARSREPSPRTMAEGTRWLSCAPGLRQIAHQVFVKAGSAALSAEFASHRDPPGAGSRRPLSF